MACPEDENSTDCLLRELLKAINDKDEEFNWDPLNFAFTVPIGLVAALFAALTVFQVILSAGSGRRRCNEITIGRWSKLTTRRWSWHDLMILSTAKTPLLRSDRILKILDDNKNAQPNPGNPAYGSTDQFPNGASAASWLKFLQEINLDEISLEDLGKDKNIAETPADYLPSDLIAVPAYGEVGLIVAMAAAAGAYSWKFNSQSPYPIIIGEDFQFDFRQHPTLGTVGAFSRYVQRVEKSSVSRKYLAKAIEHARGNIDIATLFPLDKKVKEYLSLNEDPVSVNVVELPDFQHLLRGIHEQEECTTLTRGDLCNLPTYFDRSDEHLLWLFIAATPEHPPAIFPSDLIHVPNLLSILALNSKFWGAEQSIDETRRMPDLLNGLRWIDNFPENDPSADHQEIIGYVNIYQGCIQMLYEPQAFQAWFDSRGRSKRQVFRQGVLVQLQQLDKWLQKRDRKQEIRCSIVDLYRITNALLKAENAITNGSWGASAPADQAGAQRTNHGDDSRQDTTSGQFNLDDEYLGIIVYRHSKTLTELRNLVEECLPKADLKDIIKRHKVETVDNFMRHSKLLRALTGISPSLFSSLLNFSHIVVLLQTLRKLLEVWKNTKKADLAKEEDHTKKEEHTMEEDHTKKEEHTMEEDHTKKEEQTKKEQHTKKEELSERSDRDIIKDVLIWRCILIYLLFWTAPDNSKVLTSGTWEQVIPIL